MVYGLLLWFIWSLRSVRPQCCGRCWRSLWTCASSASTRFATPSGQRVAQRRGRGPVVGLLCCELQGYVDLRRALRVQISPMWAIYGFYTRNRNDGFGTILCIWVLGPLGAVKQGSETTSCSLQKRHEDLACLAVQFPSYA